MFYALVSSPSTGGMIARRLLPAVIALPLVLGWIVLRVHESELFDEPTAFGLIAFVSTAALTAVVWFTCQRLVNIDRERRESGAALRASEAVFTSFAQNAPVAMYMKDIKGVYIFHNREGERVYGHLDSALRGKTARDVHHRRRSGGDRGAGPPGDRLRQARDGRTAQCPLSRL